MHQSRFSVMTRFAGLLLAVAVVGGICAHTSAPQRAQNKKPLSLEPGKGQDDDDTNRPLTEMEEELRAKRAIKLAEKEYQENLDRARELSNVSAAIATSFKQKSALWPEDLKRLEKVEKLAKSIRRAAGGSEDDTKMDKPPADMAAAVGMLGELSHSLKSRVEKTPKHVISAAVIDEANVLLELVRIVRTLSAKG